MTTTTTGGGYRITEVARRTGFSPATLRYYEQVGVVPPPERSPAGYRVYRDHDLERLGFVARAKELGCSLIEIAELAQAWDTGECRPVKHRLRAVVDARIADVQRRTEEMVRFGAQLQATASTLADGPVEGPCDATCGCTRGPGESSAPAAAVPLKTVSGNDLGTGPPIACSLDSGEMQVRLAEWRAALAYAERRVPMKGGVRLELRSNAPLAEIARLVAAEHDCCPFFAFALTVDGRGVALEMTAPTGGPDVAALLDGLAG